MKVCTIDAQYCTRVLRNDNGFAVKTDRTMNWPESPQQVLAVLPRGMVRDGGKAGSDTVLAENPATWIIA